MLTKGQLVYYTNKVYSQYDNTNTKRIESSINHRPAKGMFLGITNLFEGKMKSMYDSPGNYDTSFEQTKTVKVYVIMPLTNVNGHETSNYMKPIYCLPEHVTEAPKSVKTV